MSDDIKQLMEDVNKTVMAIKSEQETASTKRDGEWNAKFDKMVNEMTDKVDQVQQKAAAAEAKAAALQAVLERNDANGTKTSEDEIITKSRQVFRDYLKRGSEGLIGSEFRASDEGIEIRAMATDSNPDGGYLVMPSMADFMVTRAFETSALRRRARVIKIGSKSIEVPIDDQEADATWVGEGADSSSSTTTPQVGKLTITAHKLACQPALTTEMLEDPYVDVESWLQNKIADKISRKQNTAYVSGNGIGQPRGFLDHSAWAVAGTYERNKLERINLGHASTITADGLIGLQASLLEVYQPGATWAINRKTYGDILKLKGADNYFFSPTLLKDGQFALQLLGKPVDFMDDMPVVAADALSVAYGDFSVGYTIVDRVGLQILKDPYTSKGLVTYYTTVRGGGAVTNYQSIKIGKVAA